MPVISGIAPSAALRIDRQDNVCDLQFKPERGSSSFDFHRPDDHISQAVRPWRVVDPSPYIEPNSGNNAVRAGRRNQRGVVTIRQLLLVIHYRHDGWVW